MIAGGAAAGLFGSLLGLGGGVLLVPLLTLGFGLPLRDAIGVSLVCVIVTSSASAGVFLRRHAANLRLAMTLELFTAIGAVLGAFVAFLLSERVLAGLFAGLLIYVSLSMLRSARAPAVAGDAPVEDVPNGPLAAASAALSTDDYRIRGLVPGAGASVGAGVISALLGIGGGLVLVPLMHLLMGVPLRVATATSNLMIGVTASASVVVYLLRGGIDVHVAGITAFGVILGARGGARLVNRIDLRVLRWLFVVVLLYTAAQMLRRALGIG